MDKDIKIGLMILVGIVLTVAVAIVGSIYNNNKNVERDMFYATHCKTVKETPGVIGNAYIKECN